MSFAFETVSRSSLHGVVKGLSDQFGGIGLPVVGGSVRTSVLTKFDAKLRSAVVLTIVIEINIAGPEKYRAAEKVAKEKRTR